MKKYLLTLDKRYKKKLIELEKRIEDIDQLIRTDEDQPHYEQQLTRYIKVKLSNESTRLYSQQMRIERKQRIVNRLKSIFKLDPKEYKYRIYYTEGTITVYASDLHEAERFINKHWRSRGLQATWIREEDDDNI